MNLTHLLIHGYNNSTKKGDVVIKTIANLKIPSEIIITKYKTIEQISDEQRPELIAYAKEMFPDKPDDEIEKVIKVIHTVGTLL